MQGKIWGETEQIFKSYNSSVHFLKIKKGGYCSEHKHDLKSNLFHVISGLLKIETWIIEERPDITVLKAGQSCVVCRGFFHKFTALENTSCIEIYQSHLEDPDINRRTEGGLGNVD